MISHISQHTDSQYANLGNSSGLVHPLLNLVEIVLVLVTIFLATQCFWLF